MGQTCDYCGRSSGWGNELSKGDISSCGNCGEVFCDDCRDEAINKAGGVGLDQCASCGDTNLFTSK